MKSASGQKSDSSTSPARSGSNPFATRFIRPDARPYLFAEGVSAEQLVDRLAKAGWTGQIVGPHGSGKSTLVATLLPHAVRRGRTVFHYRLHAGQRSLAAAEGDRGQWTEQALIVVDGYEQLSRWARWRLGRLWRRLGCGVLITTHQPQRYPLLYRTHASLPLLRQLVERLTADVPAASRPSDAEIARAFEEQRGNLREALLQLYDTYETARRASPERQTPSA